MVDVRDETRISLKAWRDIKAKRKQERKEARELASALPPQDGVTLGAIRPGDVRENPIDLEKVEIDFSGESQQARPTVNLNRSKRDGGSRRRRRMQPLTDVVELPPLSPPRSDARNHRSMNRSKPTPNDQAPQTSRWAYEHAQHRADSSEGAIYPPQFTSSPPRWSGPFNNSPYHPSSGLNHVQPLGFGPFPGLLAPVGGAFADPHR